MAWWSSGSLHQQRTYPGRWRTAALKLNVCSKELLLSCHFLVISVTLLIQYGNFCPPYRVVVATCSGTLQINEICNIFNLSSQHAVLGITVWERPKVRDARKAVTQETETALSFIPVVQKTLSVTSVSWFSCGWGQICHWCKLVQHYWHQLTTHEFTPGDNLFQVFSATKPRGQQMQMNPKAARSYEMKGLFLIVDEHAGWASQWHLDPVLPLFFQRKSYCWVHSESIHKVVYHSGSHP